jgi:hypothetical protein
VIGLKGIKLVVLLSAAAALYFRVVRTPVLTWGGK